MKVAALVRARVPGPSHTLGGPEASAVPPPVLPLLLVLLPPVLLLVLLPLLPLPLLPLLPPLLVLPPGPPLLVLPLPPPLLLPNPELDEPPHANPEHIPTTNKKSGETLASTRIVIWRICIHPSPRERPVVDR